MNNLKFKVIVIVAFIIGVIVGVVSNSLLSTSDSILNSKPKFQHYGIFVKGADTKFHETKQYSWSGMDDEYADSKNFNSEPIQIENRITIIIYDPKAKLNDYRLLGEPKKDKSGNYNCGNWSVGYKCSEIEVKKQPVKGKDDMLKLTAELEDGIFILHNRNENKGNIFSVMKKK